MSNGLTGLIPVLYSSLDVVSREITGILAAMTLDPTASRAAKGQTVSSFVAPASTASDITPGVTPPDDGDQTIGKVDIVITKSRRVPIRWNGEDTLGVNSGPGQRAIQVNQVAQAVRTLVNEMETDAAALYSTFSRAYGTAGADPFASDLSDPAQLRKILVDNGAPISDLQAVINTAAGAKMRSLPNLTRVNEAGSDVLMKQGILHALAGFEIRESFAIKTPAIGTSNNAGTTDTTGYAKGATAITLAAAGTGTILAGDLVTFTGDTNKYVVATGVASLAAGGVLTLAAPGLQVALAASAITVTVVAIGARNMAFARTALVLAARLPALPPGGKDLATDRTTITDPRSGMTFEIAEYMQYRQVQYEISAAWGVKNVKPEHTGILIGK